MENKMFCYQCQETAGCTGCTKVGFCGKSPELARLQDLLIYTTKGLSEVTTRLREEGKTIDTIGGQVDILPTLSYLFGVDSSKYDNSTLGRNLLNTNKNFAVLSTRKIISTGLSEEEQQYMIDSLDLSDKLIRANYFRKE